MARQRRNLWWCLGEKHLDDGRQFKCISSAFNDYGIERDYGLRIGRGNVASNGSSFMFLPINYTSFIFFPKHRIPDIDKLLLILLHPAGFVNLLNWARRGMQEAHM